MKNFCANKTTNERFARRANSTASDRSQSERSNSNASSLRSSSVASSVGRGTQDLQQILDEQNRGCASNCYQMCCNNKMVDQMELFKK